MRKAMLPVLVLAFFVPSLAFAADPSPQVPPPDSKPQQAQPAPAAASSAISKESPKPVQETSGLPVPGSDPKGGDAALEEGMELFKAGKYTDSADRLSTAVGYFPNYPRAALLLANSDFAMGNFETASDQLRRGLLLKGALESELKELKEIWRDYALYRQRVEGLGKLAEDGGKPDLALLYGFYYALAGYREHAAAILNGFPHRTEEFQAAKVILHSRLPEVPWVDLPPPTIPAVGKKGEYAEGSLAGEITRHMTIGIGLGGDIITGQIRSSNHSQLEGYSSTRFFVGFLIDKLVIDANFTWQYLHGDLLVPGIGYGRDIGLNLYSAGLEVTYHFIRKPGTKGFDPSARVGYSFLDLETNSWYYAGGYYYSGVNAGIGHGPLAAISLDYVFAYMPVDFSLGLDVFYQVFIIHNDYGHLDGGGLNIQAKFGFVF